MLNVNTDLLMRLKAKDAAAWYELWEVFGPSIERMVGSIANRYFSQETVKDVSQETLARVYKEISRFDTKRGVKFSTWLYAIAKNVVLTELTRRHAQKRNSGEKPQSIDSMEGFDPSVDDTPPEFEVSVFRAKVLRALKNVEASVGLIEFESYRIKLSENLQGKDIAGQLGISEASVSRYIKKVRDEARCEIARAVAVYSWTEGEEREISGAGLDRIDDESFDAALADVYSQAEGERKTYGTLSRTAQAIRGTEP